MKEVHLRPAEPNDALLLFRWRNDADAMKHSGDRTPFTWHEHKLWVHDALTDPYRTLLVGETANGSLPIPVGTVRLDHLNGIDTVSITVDPIMRKMGFGHAMLTKLVEQHGKKPIIAHVKRDNTQSLQLFQKCGFKPVEPEDIGWLVEQRKDPVWCVLRRDPEPTHSLSFRESE